MPQLNRGYDTSFLYLCPQQSKRIIPEIVRLVYAYFFAGERQIPITIVQCNLWILDNFFALRFCSQRMTPVTYKTGQARPERNTKILPVQPKALPLCNGHCQSRKMSPPLPVPLS
jgi:hypothetical protein